MSTSVFSNGLQYLVGTLIGQMPNPTKAMDQPWIQRQLVRIQSPSPICLMPPAEARELARKILIACTEAEVINASLDEKEGIESTPTPEPTGDH